MTSTEEKYLECSCTQCGGGISFPDHGVGMTISCPHCSQDTVLSFEATPEITPREIHPNSVPAPAPDPEPASDNLDSDMSKPLDFSWPQRRAGNNAATGTGKIAQPNPRYASMNMAKPINFFFTAPNASSVSLVGEFNGWNPEIHPLKRKTDGIWAVEVALRHGHHEYAFMVDGKRFLDPRASGTGRNDKNERVSLIAVS
jgi:hypothetical protein